MFVKQIKLSLHLRHCDTKMEKKPPKTKTKQDRTKAMRQQTKEIKLT